MKTTMLGTLLALALLACGRDDNAMGPAQRAGKVLDQAGVQGFARQMEGELAKADRIADTARGKVKDATKGTRGGLKHAGGEIGKRMEDAGKKIQDVLD